MTEPTELVENIPQKKKLSTGAKWGIGCGSGCLIFILIFIALIIGGGVFVKQMVTKYETELTELGFENVVSGQMLNITEPIQPQQLLKAQSVIIFSDSETDVAMLAQIGEIHGTINGTLYFRGQVLTIQPGAQILGDLDIKAQVLDNRGEITGEIIGSCQTMTTPTLPAPTE